MKTKTKLLTGFGLALILAAAVAIGLFFSPETSAQKRDALFSLKETPAARPGGEKYSVASVRESEIVFDGGSLRAENSEILSFPLFDGKIHRAVRNPSEGLEVRGSGDFTWRGKLSDNSLAADVTLTFKKGRVWGLIYSPDGVYEIVAKGDKQILVELDQSLFPECAGDVKGKTEKREAAENLGAGSDSGDRIDVLVVYTPATKNILGGDAQAQTLAQQSIDITNTTYLNSKIRQRVRLVHAEEYQYTETSSASTDLSALRNNAGIQNLRNTHNADLVAMIGEIQGACGIGYLMGAVSTSSQGNAYTFTGRTCAVGNLSFPHELGHNMGSTHNPENGSSASYPYGYGHWIDGNYRTVMSYSNPCTQGCTRRPYFSNPAIVFNGAPTGINNQRDNARSINNTADTIANYRYSGKSLTLNNFNGAEALPRIISRSVNWSSDNLGGNVKIEISRDESTGWETLIASTPNDGSETINVYGRPTRRARLRITSLSDPAVSDSSVANISIR
ncbi:MAG: M12 family metallo-peptidase [Pyrinomonadaceae bacterium]